MASPNDYFDIIWIIARKRVKIVTVRFSESPTTVNTLEGPVHCAAGDAIITGVKGELWPVEKARFPQIYEPAPNTISGENGAYFSRPLTVSAAKLNRIFRLELSEHRGSLTGQIGDWLVRHPDGGLGIVASDIFNQTYEVLE
jgi:hypothetical protein